MTARLFARASIVCLLLSLWIVVDASVAEAQCQPCSVTERNNELTRMYALYQTAVNNARQTGFQCGSDPNYTDQGGGTHPVGNCADWATVSWAALVVHSWECWRVTKVRARRKFSWRTYHNFVYIEPKCNEGPRVYLDPWRSGRPDVFVGDDAFPISTGFFGGWIFYPVETHEVGAPPRQP